MPPPLAELPGSDETPEPAQLPAGRVANRLRGLVGSIDVYTNLLTQTLRTRAQRELSLRILEGTAQVKRLADQLTRYSTPICPVVRPTRISTLIERLRHVIGAAGWERVMVQHSTTASASVIADPVLLQLALTALLQNALDASAEQPIHLSLSADAASRPMRFEVWNAGTIASDLRPDRIFAPFFSTKHGQWGMGLPMARRIAEAHGGTMHSVHASAEAGTRFAPVLPSHPVLPHASGSSS